MHNNCFFENWYQRSRDRYFQVIVQFSDFVKGFTERSTGKKVWNFSKNGHSRSKIGKLVGGSPKQDLLRGSATRCHLWPKLWANVAVVSSRVAMSTGQEAVTPQKPPGGGIVAPSPAALSPVSERGFLTTITSLSREATRVWAISVSDHCKGDKEVLIDVVLWSARSSGTHGYFDVHHQQGTCVQSPVVCAQSVTSAATICSNLWGRWRADSGPDRAQTMNIGNNLGAHVYAWGVLSRKPCEHCPHSVFRPFQFPAGRQCR